MNLRITLFFMSIILFSALMLPSVVAQGTLERLWMELDSALDVAVSANGQYVIASFGDEVRFYLAEGDGTPLWSSTNPQVIMTDVAISADGNQVVVGLDSLFDGGAVAYFNDTTTMSGGLIVPTWASTDLGPLERGTVDISDNGEYVVAVGTGTGVYYFETCTTKSGGGIGYDWVGWTPVQWLECVDMTPDGRYIATAGWRPVEESVDVYLFFFDMNIPDMLWYLEAFDLPDMTRFQDIAVSDDGYGVAASVTVGLPDDASMIIYFADATQLQGQVIQSAWMWMEMGLASTSVAISSSGEEVVYGSSPIPFTLCYWKGAKTLVGYADPPNWTMPLNVFDVAISGDGEVVAASTDEPGFSWYLRLYNRYGVELASDELLSPGNFLSMSRDGTIIAVAGDQVDSLYVYRFTRPVGGEILPINTIQLIAPYLIVMIIIVSSAIIFYKKRIP